MSMCIGIICLLALLCPMAEANPCYTVVVGQYRWGAEPVVIDAAADLDVSTNGQVHVREPAKFEWLRAGIVEMGATQEILFANGAAFERCSLHVGPLPNAKAQKSMVLVSISVSIRDKNGMEQVVAFENIPVIPGIGAFPQGPPDADSKKSRMFIFARELLSAE